MRELLVKSYMPFKLNLYEVSIGKESEKHNLTLNEQ